MHIATVSSKNQIAIPVKILRKLGLKPGNKIILEEKAGQINARPVKTSVVDELAGSLTRYIPAKKRHMTWDEIRDETQTEVAKYLIKKYNLPRAIKKK